MDFYLNSMLSESFVSETVKLFSSDLFIEKLFIGDPNGVAIVKLGKFLHSFRV